MPSVLKLVSCKPGASREVALRPPRHEKLKIILISLKWLNVPVVVDMFQSKVLCVIRQH